MNNYSSPLFLTPDITLKQGEKGVCYIESKTPLNPGPASVVSYLKQWATKRPETIFLAEHRNPDSNEWTTITYNDFLQQATQIASNLKPLELSVDHPLLILSGNSINNALLMFAGFLLGVPVVPVSPSYSLLSKRYEKVHYIQELTDARVVFAETTAGFDGVLQALEEKGLQVITADAEKIEQNHILLSELLINNSDLTFKPVDPEPDTVAKIMFTSGSTGMPKGVINTHKMLTCNQEAIAQMWPFIERPNHVFLDWLPWHHTFGGNHNLNMVLRNGASLYIDNGKPTPDGIKLTVKNIMDISPTMSFNVAAGYDLLATALEDNPVAAQHFFKNLSLIFFAAAALPQTIWQRLERLIEQYANRPIPITSSWGQTETAPLSTSVYFDSKVPNNIGVPIPGTQLKLAPVGDMTELRVKGPNVMPSYFKNKEKTQEVFDEEGYLCSGDAVELCNAEHPEQGLIFKGRVSENFKLQSGTWVNVGELRLALISALSPLASDIVICGHNEKQIGILIFPNISACQQQVNTESDAETLVKNDVLKDLVQSRLSAYNKENSASSKRIHAAILQAKPPAFEEHEITDKGYINQRGVLKHRANDVAKLYSDNRTNDVIFLD